jgi:YidC/Oxa1 family membrane protein insertase
MDRTSWIAIIICVVGLFAWQWYVTENYTQPPAETAPATPPTPEPTPGTATAPAEPAPTPEPVRMQARAESLDTPAAEFVFNNDTGGINQVVLALHMGENSERVSLNRSRTMPIGAMGFAPGEVLGGFTMQKAADGSIVFTSTLDDGLRITKRFSLPDQDADDTTSYLVDLSVTFENTSGDTIQVPEYFIGTGGAAPIHLNDLPMYTRFDWGHGTSMSKVDVNWFPESSIPIIGIQLHGERDLYLESEPEIRWAAVASQYFCTIVTPSEPASALSVWAKRFEAPKLNGSPIFGIQGGITLAGPLLAPGAQAAHPFRIYAGPKELERLRALGGNQEEVMSFGIFGFVSEFLLWAMNSIHGLIGNYAASIILLTILIKSALWPVQNKATREMRKMALLSPKMTELREKHKDNPQKMNEEVMKLYKEYGVNPFSGCLPMLIQIPIFFGFYSMLGTAIELRNSSFLWVADLSQPDTVAHILGFPINVLPIVMAGTMIWQMVITPKTGDAVQQRIFYFMPVIFLVFCYNYASGLALYWTTQNIFSIVQLYLTRNQPLPTLEKKSVVAKRNAIQARKKTKKRPSP